MTDFAKLNAKGIVAWEVDGVLARFSRKQSKDPAAIDLLTPLVQLGAEQAAAIRHRVQVQGDLGEQSWSGYSTQRRKYKVPPRYAGLAGVGGKVFGFRARAKHNQPLGPAHPVAVFRSSADFHAQSRSGSSGAFAPTGGMWAGLQARASGDNAVRIEFGGSSPGKGPNVRVPDVMAKRGFVAVPTDALVQNKFKGGAIFDKARVNVLQPTVKEDEAVFAGINRQLERFTLLTLSLA